MQAEFMDELYAHASTLSRPIRHRLYHALSLEFRFHEQEQTFPQHWQHQCKKNYITQMNSLLDEDDLVLIGPDISSPSAHDNVRRYQGKLDLRDVPLFTTLSHVHVKLDRDLGAYKRGAQCSAFLLKCYMHFSQTTKGAVLDVPPAPQRIAFLLDSDPSRYGQVMGVFFGSDYGSFVPAADLITSDSGATVIYVTQDVHFLTHQPGTKSTGFLPGSYCLTGDIPESMAYRYVNTPYASPGHIAWRPNFSEDLGHLPEQHQLAHQVGRIYSILSVLTSPVSGLASLLRRRTIKQLSLEEGPDFRKRQDRDIPPVLFRGPLVGGRIAIRPDQTDGFSLQDFQEDAQMLTSDDLKQYTSIRSPR